MDIEENKSALPTNEEEKKNNGHSRKKSDASVMSNNMNNEDDDDGDEEEEDEKDAVILGPVVGLKEQLEKDKVLVLLINFLHFHYFFSSLSDFFLNHTQIPNIRQTQVLSFDILFTIYIFREQENYYINYLAENI